MHDSDRELAVLSTMLNRVADRLETEKEQLTELDSRIGDADHGENIARGFQEAADEFDPAEFDALDAAVQSVGTTLLSEIGGAAGPLYGSAVRSGGKALPADNASGADTVQFAEAYLDALTHRSNADVGEKTMIDAVVPAVHTYKRAIEQDGVQPVVALARAVDACERGVAFTIPIKAEQGRASYLGWRSVGHQDPGATSTLYILEEILSVVEEIENESPTRSSSVIETNSDGDGTHS